MLSLKEKRAPVYLKRLSRNRTKLRNFVLSKDRENDKIHIYGPGEKMGSSVIRDAQNKGRAEARILI